jgi:hypothetical protein
MLYSIAMFPSSAVEVGPLESSLGMGQKRADFPQGQERGTRSGSMAVPRAPVRPSGADTGPRMVDVFSASLRTCRSAQHTPRNRVEESPALTRHLKRKTLAAADH